MKRFALVITILAMGMTSADVSAEPPQQRRPGNAVQSRPNNGQGRQRDPRAFVAEMMKKFDVDGDQKLDSRELTSLLTSLRERGGQQAMARRGGQPGPGQGAGQNRRRGGIQRGGEEGKPGGQRPKRPGAAE